MKTPCRLLCWLIAAGLAAATPPANGANELPAFRHVRTLREARPAEVEFRDEGVAIRGIAFSQDGKSLAAVTADRALLLCELPSGRVRGTLDDTQRFHRVTFSPDGRLLVYGGFGARSYRPAEEGAEPFRTETNWADTLALSPDHSVRVARKDSHHLAVLGTKSKQALARVDLFGGMGPIDTGLYKPSVNSYSFSPDGRRLALGIELFDDELPRLYRTQVWNIRSGELQGVFNGIDSRFVPDGKTLVTSNDGRVELRSAETLERVAALEASASTNLCELSSDGTIVAAVSGEKVLVGTVASRKLAAVLKGLGSPVTSISISHDGKLLAAGSRNGAIQLWTADEE